MLDSCENSRTDLSSAALTYLNRGWSFIPVRGDSDLQNPKAAAIQWSEYQRRKPTNEEVDSWFGNGHFQGLGIVCGRVSRLAVLDIDDPGCAAAFATSLPDLCETFTVESGVRGLPHYYYHVPDSVQLRTQRVAGADLQFERTYVVAPPTMISGTQWQVVNDYLPHVLSQADVERIIRFLATWQYLSQTGSGRDSSFSEAVTVTPVTVSPSLDGNSGRLSGDVLVGWYRRLAKSGRNNALFRVSCLARDSGWSHRELQALLLDVHVVQPSSNRHQVETPQQRQHEGYQTIHSAFRYAVRPRTVSSKQALGGLPNAIREALLQRKQSSVARVLDGLRFAGIESGRAITERVVCQVLRIFNIGRRTVQSALKSLNAAGHAIFETPRNPPKDDACAAIAEEKEQKKCLFVSGAKRVKTGRPARQYLIPDNQKLYRLLNTRPSGSDTLVPADLKSPNAYRQALQRALIERRPGLYSRWWLSARLGISVWTCRRYDRHLDLNVNSTYFSTRISWSNVEQLPSKVTQKEGIFLETPEGKRYPPVRGLAKRLLQHHAHLIQKRQHWNYYSIGNEYYESNGDHRIFQSEKREQSDCEEFHKNRPVHNVSLDSTASCAQPDYGEPLQPLTMAEPEPRLWVCPACMKQRFSHTHPGTCSRCGGDSWESATAAIWRDPERCGVWWQGLWKAHKLRSKPSLRPQRPGLTATQHKLIDSLYRAIRAKTPSHALTYAAARQLVLDCGEVAVERALALLAERRNVYNAAGFVMSVLRGATGHTKQYHAADSITAHQDWVAQVKQSPYARFYANEI